MIYLLIKIYEKYFFITKYKIIGFLFIFFAFNLPIICTNYIDNSLLTNSNKTGYFMDYAAFISVGILGVPFLVLYILIFYSQVKKIETIIYESKVICINRYIFRGISKKYHKRIKNKWSFFLIIPSMFINFTWILDHKSNNIESWLLLETNSSIVLSKSALIYVVSTTLYYFITLNILLNILFTYMMLFEISKKATFKINPLHPDQCGGLSSIGNISFINSIPMVFIGICIVTILFMDIFKHKLEVFTGIHIFIVTLYLVLSMGAFFIPLTFFRHHMIKEKLSILTKVSNFYNTMYYDVMSKSSLNIDELRDLENLDVINSIYERSNKMPIWPFNISIIKKYIIIISSPFTLFIFPIIVDKIKEKMIEMFF